MSQERVAVEKIIAYWKAGKKEEARNYFKLSCWVLSDKVKEYFNAKLYGMPSPKEMELLKYACDVMGGGRVYHNGKVIYEKNPDKIKE